MARKKRRKITVLTNHRIIVSALFAIIALSGVGFGIYHLMQAYAKEAPIIVQVDPNVGVRAQVEEFFTANDAPEMIPIIGCESQFKHYNTNGSILKNRAGSSAVGVAQIIASKHPDQKVLDVYNKRHNTDLAISDFNIETIEGNLGYALALYRVRGIRDWECSKKFRFK